MKKIISLLLVVLLFCFLLSGCSVYEENKSLKAKNQELEQRVKELEKTITELSQRDVELDLCLKEAKNRYEATLKVNSTVDKTGMISVPLSLLQGILLIYKDNCEQCYRRYGRRE